MTFIPIILSLVITKIHTAFNIEPILPTIVNNTLSNCTIVTMVERHSQGNILTIIAILWEKKIIFLYFVCNTPSHIFSVINHESEIHDTLYYLFYLFCKYPIHLNLTLSSTLIEAPGENNAMNQVEQKHYNPLDEDKTSEGLQHLHENELPADGIPQIDVHCTISK